jgi:glycosyltransferase 2 family protein
MYKPPQQAFSPHISRDYTAQQNSQPVMSFLIQFSDVLSYRVVASAIQLPVQLGDLFLFVPLLYLAILLPFSINGIGIREMVFVFFAAGWGISQSDAVAFSLTVFTLNLAGSLAGAPIYWFRRR